MAQPTQAQRAGEHRQLVVFFVAKESYGVDIRQAREIIRVPEITRVPRAPAFVEGVLNLRGGVIPVLDLRKRFGLGVRSGGSEERIVVIEMDDETVGMIVDGVSEVLEVDAEQIDPPSPYVVSVDSQYVDGIAKIGEKLIILLEMSKVLSKTEKDMMADMAAPSVDSE